MDTGTLDVSALWRDTIRLHHALTNLVAACESPGGWTVTDMELERARRVLAATNPNQHNGAVRA